MQWVSMSIGNVRCTETKPSEAVTSEPDNSTSADHVLHSLLSTPVVQKLFMK